MWHASFAYNMTHSHAPLLNQMLHDSFMWDTQISFMWDIHNSFMWDIHISFMWDRHIFAWRGEGGVPALWNVQTKTIMRHDSIICAMTHLNMTWLIHMWHHSFTCVMTRSYAPWAIHVWQDSLANPCTTWFIHIKGGGVPVLWIARTKRYILHILLGPILWWERDREGRREVNSEGEHKIGEKGEREKE